MRTKSWEEAAPKHLTYKQGSPCQSPLRQIGTKCVIWRVNKQSDWPNCECSISALFCDWFQLRFLVTLLSLFVFNCTMPFTLWFLEILTQHKLQPKLLASIPKSSIFILFGFYFVFGFIYLMYNLWNISDCTFGIYIFLLALVNYFKIYAFRVC